MTNAGFTYFAAALLLKCSVKCSLFAVTETLAVGEIAVFPRRWL